MQSDSTGFGFVGFLIWLIFMIPVVWAYVRIVQKAGYSGWNVIWAFIPIANIVMFFVFAFGTWPIERKLATLEQPRAF